MEATGCDTSITTVLMVVQTPLVADFSYATLSNFQLRGAASPVSAVECPSQPAPTSQQTDTPVSASSVSRSLRVQNVRQRNNPFAAPALSSHHHAFSAGPLVKPGVSRQLYRRREPLDIALLTIFLCFKIGKSRPSEMNLFGEISVFESRFSMPQP